MDSDDEKNEYEQLRRKCEMAKKELLQGIGFGARYESTSPKLPKAVRKKSSSVQSRMQISKGPVRKSPRLSKLQGINLQDEQLGHSSLTSASAEKEIEQELPVPSIQIEKRLCKLSCVPNVFSKDRFKLNKMGDIRFMSASGYMDFVSPEKLSDNMELEKKSLENILPHLKLTPSSNHINQVKKSFDDFTESLKRYTSSPMYLNKVGLCPTYSMVIHPTETKLLTITGDAEGYLSFWDVNSISKADKYRPHTQPIFCLSVCDYNPVKLYATAINGILRSCDMEKLEFSDVYVTELDHTCCHAQLTPHSFLVGHGCGDVGLMDTRVRENPTKWFDCHRKSIKTIQLHPEKGYEFVTSSRCREVGLWDIRRGKCQKSLMLFQHPKGVRSAYYSPGGGLLLTSCNDDKIRIYSLRNYDLLMSMNYLLDTGDNSRPLEAKWHPSREDVFVIGCTNAPHKVGIYGIHGIKLISLTDENMSSPITHCTFHRSLPVVAGADNSGFVYVFTGFENVIK